MIPFADMITELVLHFIKMRAAGRFHVPLILLDSFRWLVLTPGWSSASADILHR